MVYRNIFFLENGFSNGNGSMIIEYIGRIYYHAQLLRNFKELYNPSQDLLISCKDCAKRKYKSFKKVSRQFK